MTIRLQCSTFCFRWRWNFSCTLRSFYPCDKIAGTHWEENYMGLIIGLHTVANRQILAHVEI